MISDVLAGAIEKIDRYMSDAYFRRTYHGALRTRILLVRNAMEDLRNELDTAPDVVESRE